MQEVEIVAKMPSNRLFRNLASIAGFAAITLMVGITHAALHGADAPIVGLETVILAMAPIMIVQLLSEPVTGEPPHLGVFIGGFATALLLLSYTQLDPGFLDLQRDWLDGLGTLRGYYPAIQAGICGLAAGTLTLALTRPARIKVALLHGGIAASAILLLFAVSA